MGRNPSSCHHQLVDIEILLLICIMNALNRRCQVCRVIEDIMRSIMRSKASHRTNIKPNIKLCIADVNEASLCGLDPSNDVMCYNVSNASSCPDMLIIIKRRRAIECYVIELKLNVKSREALRLKDYIGRAEQQLNSSCAHSICQTYCCGNTERIVVFSEEVYKKIEGIKKQIKREGIKVVKPDMLFSS